MHTRLPCPSPSPRVHSNSCPLSQWCHPTISSSVVPFSSCLQSFPASGFFPVSRLFESRGQSIGVSASVWVSVLPMNVQGGFPLGLTGWISLQSKGLSRVLFNTKVWKINSLELSLLYGPTLVTTSKTIAWTLVSKVMSLFFSMSRFVIAFLPRSKHFLISCLQSSSAMIWEPKKRKSVTVSIFSPSIYHEMLGPDAMILVFEHWVLSQLFHSPLSPSRGSLVPCHFLPFESCLLHIWGCWFLLAILISNLCFIQPSILYDALCISVKEIGWQYTALSHSFHNCELLTCSTSSSNCCFLTCIQASQETCKVVW